MKRSEKEKDAALEYTKERNALKGDRDEQWFHDNGIDDSFNEIYHAFLAGIDWYKRQIQVKPDKEYYGF